MSKANKAKGAGWTIFIGVLFAYMIFATGSCVLGFHPELAERLGCEMEKGPEK